MAVMGISGMAVTGTMGDTRSAQDTAALQKEANKFADLIKNMQKKTHRLSRISGK